MIAPPACAPPGSLWGRKSAIVLALPACSLGGPAGAGKRRGCGRLEPVAAAQRACLLACRRETGGARGLSKAVGYSVSRRLRPLRKTLSGSLGRFAKSALTGTHCLRAGTGAVPGLKRRPTPRTLRSSQRIYI
jgi:hypothetical protein